MIDDENVVVIEGDDQGGDEGAPTLPDAGDGSSAPDAVPSGASPGSLLGLIGAAIDEAAEDAGDVKDLPVGKIPRLYARYRALDDDEIEEINKQTSGREKLRKRVGQGEVDIEGSNQRSAILLARACDMLLWRDDDGNLVPLHEALQAQGVEVDGPLRYDRRLVALFALEDLSPEASSVQIAMRLHRWGKDNNYAPLRGIAQIVEMFSSGLSGEALEAALQGN